MFLYTSTKFCTLHAGTPVALSQLTLAIMLTVLGIVILGIGFPKLKSKEGLLRHRYTLTVALALALVGVFLVMAPTFFVYFIDPDLEFLSSISITTLIHSILAFPAIISAIIYAFGDLPKKVRKWMRITAILWIATTIAGVILFLQMVSII